MNKPFQMFLLVVMALGLFACAGGAGYPAAKAAEQAAAQGRDYLPGGVTTYDLGLAQSKENFANVEHAQSNFGLNANQRVWQNIYVAVRPSAQNVGFNSYHPLHVRWKLKDGREFILEDIDIRAIMREYFKTHEIQMPWQKEGRLKETIGDSDPLLSHEVKDDTVRIKWVITTNHTPVNQRLTATGAATRWIFTDEEYLVTTLKGLPTSGIDFTQQWEFNTPKPQAPKL